MTIIQTRIQRCDACGRERSLPTNDGWASPILGGSERNGGWRDAPQGKHVCNECLRKITTRGTDPDV